MAIKQGVVERIGQKKTQRGGTLYSVLLDDSVWYSFGFDKPKKEFDKGDTVKFDVIKNDAGYDQIDGDSLKVKRNPNAGQGKTASGGLTRDQYWANKEERDIATQKQIRYAGSINSALSFCNELIALGVFPVAATTLKKKEGLDAALEVVYKVADELYLRIGSRPDQLEALSETLTEEEVSGQEDLKKTEKETEDNDDDWGDD